MSLIYLRAVEVKVGFNDATRDFPRGCYVVYLIIFNSVRVSLKSIQFQLLTQTSRGAAVLHMMRLDCILLWSPFCSKISQ